MRISQANEDCQRAPNHQSPSSQRTQATLRLKDLPLRGKLPKKVRLRTRHEFRRIQREGQRFQGNLLVFQFIRENLAYPRLGITVSKQFGPAVMRNLLKRRLREVFRLEKHLFPPGLSLHVSPRPQIARPTFEQIKSDFNLLLELLNKKLIDPVKGID